MTARAGRTRDRMLDSAVVLLRERGANAVTLDAVLARSGAPRGSVYHHFPGGRDEIVLAAARQAGDYISTMIDKMLDPHEPEVTIDRFIAFWTRVVSDSDHAAGCPIVALAVDHRDDFPAADELVAEVLARWQEQIATSLRAGGHDAEDARRYAVLVLAATEGAILMARAQRSITPLEDVGRILREVLNRPDATATT